VQLRFPDELQVLQGHLQDFALLKTLTTACRYEGMHEYEFNGHVVKTHFNDIGPLLKKCVFISVVPAELKPATLCLVSKPPTTRPPPCPSSLVIQFPPTTFAFNKQHF